MNFSPRAHAGFTLIELLMVLAIVITLATIAIPQYQKYVAKGNRGDGASAIQNILAAQERYYTDHMSYTTDLSKLGSGLSTSERGHYSLSAAACSNTIPLSQCVEITATASGQQAVDGNLVANTQGTQYRLVGGQKEKW